MLVPPTQTSSSNHTSPKGHDPYQTLVALWGIMVYFFFFFVEPAPTWYISIIPLISTKEAPQAISARIPGSSICFSAKVILFFPTIFFPASREQPNWFPGSLSYVKLTKDDSIHRTPTFSKLVPSSALSHCIFSSLLVIYVYLTTIYPYLRIPSTLFSLTHLQKHLSGSIRTTPRVR